MEQRGGNRYQGLEGIRAYAFILVFVVHYTVGLVDFAHIHDYRWALYPLVFVAQFSWIAVPVFFVLSGFLITGILYDTSARKRFFKAFYGRRAIRVLPLYYMVLAIVAILAFALHLHLRKRDISYIIYLHNLFLSRTDYTYGHYFSLAHLWSLAVEEQFYILWPLVVWFVRRREWLLRVSYAIIAAVVVLRICWPLTPWSLDQAYFSTFARCDGLMVGAVLALHKRKAGFQLEALVGPAKVVLGAGFLLFLGKMLLTGNALPADYFGVAVLMPAINIMSAAFIVLALLPGNRVHHYCNRPWAASIGAKTYSLYVIHFMWFPFFLYSTELLKQRMGAIAAHALTISLATVATYTLASLSFRYIEVPGMQWKSRLPYGTQIESTTVPLTAVILWVRKKWVATNAEPTPPLETLEDEETAVSPTEPRRGLIMSLVAPVNSLCPALERVSSEASPDVRVYETDSSESFAS